MEQHGRTPSQLIRTMQQFERDAENGKKPSEISVNFDDEKSKLEDTKSQTNEDVKSVGKFSTASKSERKKRMHDFLALLASLQFAVVILISRVRIGQAHENGESGESFVVISMLLITSASSKIELVFRGEDQMKTSRDFLRFLCISLPVFFYLVVCEFWFMYLLFGFYEPEVHLKGLGGNKFVVLKISQVLSVLKVSSVVILFVVYPLLKHKYAQFKDQLKEEFKQQELAKQGSSRLN